LSRGDALTLNLDAIRALVASLDEPHNGDWSLELLRHVRSIEILAASAQRQAVPAAYAAGHSWAEIGSCLHMSRQAAHKRFADLVPDYVLGAR